MQTCYYPALRAGRNEYRPENMKIAILMLLISMHLYSFAITDTVYMSGCSGTDFTLHATYADFVEWQNYSHEKQITIVPSGDTCLLLKHYTVRLVTENNFKCFDTLTRLVLSDKISNIYFPMHSLQAKNLVSCRFSNQ